MEENRYEKALERAKSAIKECGGNVGRIKMIESIFPELAGDMDDQSRKWILEYLYDGLRKADEQFEGQFKAAIAYLEKLKDIDKRLEVQYKRGYDDGYLEGIVNAKKELEKQGEHANFLSKIQVGDKVTRNEDGVLVNLSQLNRVVKKLEKQAAIKDGNSIDPHFRKPITYTETKANDGMAIELTHKEVTKKSDKDGWSEEDEIGFGDTLWAINKARTISENENDMGNLWYAENWLKNIKGRLQ